VPGREPEAEHGRRGEGRHEVLRDEGRQADAGGQLGGVVCGLEPFATRAKEQPGSHRREREHRCPAQQPVLAVDGQGDDAVGAVDDVGGPDRVSGRLAAPLGGVGGRPAVEPVVHQHAEHHARPDDLGAAERKQAAVSAQEPARRRHADHRSGRHELRPQPGEQGKQGEAADGRSVRGPLLQPQREQRGAGEQGARRELGVDGGAVGN